MRKKFLLTMFSLVLFAFCGTSLHAQDAKVGNIEYAKIDDAIANWTNGTTLTLLADVQLSDVVKLKSTEHHILDLGTYTLTAASGKHAIEITCEGRSSASYAITVNANATNPGGITATGKSCIYYKKSGSTKDRPIILINNGVFTGSYSLNLTSNGNTNCPQIWINGGTFNSYMNLTKCMLKVSGGTFHGSIYASGDQNAYRLISGGRFKSWQFMTNDNKNGSYDKFGIATSKDNYLKGIYDVGVYIDAEGYLVVGGPVIKELSAQYPAKASNYSKWSSHLMQSSAAEYGLFYEDVDMAIAKHGAAYVTIWEKPAVTIPETVTGDAEVVEEIKNNTALKEEGYAPTNLPAGAELEIELKSVGETFVFDVTPMADGAKVEPTEAITFRLPVPASVTEAYAKVYHDVTLMGIYGIQGEGNAKYVEVSSADFSVYTVEPIVPAAKIGTTAYETLSTAFAAVTDDNQTVVICKDVTENLTGAYLRGNITTEDGVKVTINLTNEDWVSCPYTFVLGENITLNVPALFYYAGGTQINGTVVADAYYQRYAGTKLTINEPGSLKVTTEQFYLRYVDDDANAGIYINGDEDASTVGLNLSVAYFYQGMINAIDANIKVGTYYQTNETDGQGSANLVLNNSTLNVTVNELDAEATGNSTVTLNNGAAMNCAGGLKVGAAANFNVENSTLVVNGVTTPNKKLFISGNSVVKIANLDGRATILDDTQLTDSYIKSPTNGTTRVLGDLTLNEGFQAAYFMTAGSATSTSDYEGTITIVGEKALKASYGLEFNGKTTFNGGTLELSGGNNSGKLWGCVFQEGTFVLNTDVVVTGNKGTYAPIHFTDATATINSFITQTNSGGEPLYIGENSVVTLGKDALINVLSVHGAGKLIIDAEGMNAGKYANVECSASGFTGTLEVINNDKLEAKIENGKIVLVEKPVAKIGEQGYATLADAFAAAENGATITLLSDITVESAIADAGKGVYNIAADKAFTLDLNGKTITATDNSNGNFILFYNYGKFTIKNGTVNLTATNDRDWNAQSSIILNRGGELVVESGNYVHNGGTDMAITICNSANSFGDATTTVKDGEIASTYTAIRNRMDMNTNGSGKAILNVEGGKISSDNRAIWAQASSASTTAPATGEINISDGEVGYVYTSCSAGAVSMTTISGGKVASFKGEAGELTVNGGEITGDITICNAAGEAIQYAVADGLYIAAVAKIGSTPYASLQEAIVAAQNGDEIDLLADVTVADNEAIMIGKSLTINGNGHKVTSSATRVFRITTGNVQVTMNELNIVSTAVRASNVDSIRGISIDGGFTGIELTLNNCSVDFTDDTASDCSYAVNIVSGSNHTLTVNGGTYEGANVINLWGTDHKVTITGAILNNIYGINDQYYGCIVRVESQIDELTLKNNTFNGTHAKVISYAANASVESLVEENNIDNTKRYVVKVGSNYYYTLEDAIAAATEDDTVTLLASITSSAIITINKPITLNGNGKTLTYTGNGTSARAIDVPAADGVKLEVTIKNLTVDCTSSYCQRGINYNEDGKLTLEGVTVKGTNVTYALNLPGSSDNATVTINNSSLTGNIALNVWGANSQITATNSVFTSVDKSKEEGYVAISLNNDGAGNAATGSVVTINGGKIIARDDNGEPSTAVRVETVATVNVSKETDVVGSIKRDVVIVTYEGSTDFYSFDNLQSAINKAKESSNATVKLIADIELTESVNVNGNVVLDLNGMTITGTDNNTASFGLINNKGNLTITGNGTITLVATNNRGWNAYSSVISNQPGGKLIVENGTIEHLGGTDMAYAIDNLTNGKGTYAETVVNGGTVKSTYRAIRQFLNGVEAENILTVNGGTIEGDNKSIWMQDPSANANTGTLTVGEKAKLIGDVYLFVTAGSTEWPVEVSIAAAALQGESTVVTGNVPAQYVVNNNNGTWGVDELEPIAKIGEVNYYDLQAAFNAGGEITVLENITLTETVTVAAGTTVVLDLNGKTVSQSKECTESYSMIQNNGKLTIKGEGAITFKDLSNGGGQSWGTYIIENNRGELVVENGTLEHFGTADNDFDTNIPIQNYAGKVTIKGGTIKSTQFRSLRDFTAGGEIIINGGNFVGQVWMQGLGTGSSSLEINGGTFQPQANDASSVFITNGTNDVNVEITDGTFNGKIGCSDATKLAGAIKGGQFNEAAKNGTNTALLAEGFVFGEADANGYYAVEEDPAYGKVAKIGETYYATLAAAYTAAQAGETVTLLADLNMSEILVLDKAITLDGNGKKLTSTAARAINVSGANGVTIKNLTINASGERAINIIENATNVTIDNVTATAANYTVNVAASAPKAVVAINNSTLNGLCTVNVAAEEANVTIDNCTVNCNDNNTTVGEVYAALCLNKAAVGGSIIATNTTVNVTEGSDSEKGRNGAENGTVTINGSTEGVTVTVAVITYPGSDNYYGFTSLAGAIEFAKAGNTITLIRDVTLSDILVINKAITLDGNGNTITTAESVATNNHAAFYIDGESTTLDVTIKNATFDGVNGAAVRSLDANVTIDNCVFQNCTNTGIQGLVRLTQGNATVKDSKFLSNTSPMALSFNYDAGNAEDVLVVDNCQFEGNTASTTALLYYVKGAKCTIKDSEFVDNTLKCNNNGATIYLGFTENNVVTGNLFKNNTVTDESSSTRVAGAIFFGYEAEVSGNAFVNNTASNANGDVLGQVCTSTYYDCTIDLGGNYWGGNAPAYGADYTVQHQTGEATFALDNYYTVCDTDEDGNVVLSDKVEIENVAKVGKFGYASLDDAVAAAVNGATITMLADVELASTVTVAGKTITLDLNGKTVSGVCNSGQSSLVYVENNAGLTVKDSAGEGKLTYAQGASNVGWTVDVKGAFTLESGTIELTGSWSIGYAVDVRPNSWGTEYTNPSVFTMNGGSIVSSDGGVRVASSSAAEHEKVSASFVMEGGSIDAAWDGVFVQQSDAIYDVLSFTMNGGTIESDLNPVRVYGPEATDYVINGQEDCMNINFNGGTMTYTGTETQTWAIEGILRVGGGSTLETILEDGCTITASATFAQALPEGYEWVASGDKYIVAPMTVVAKIGDVNYYDLQAAIDAAQNGDVIIVLEDIELTEGVTVEAGKTVTLDLNGKTVTGTPTEAAAYAVITNNGNLTIEGEGSIVCNHTLAGSTSYAVNTITNCGTLTIDGATIENTSTAANQIGYAIDNNSTTGNAVVVVKSGDVSATGSNYYDGIRQFCNSLTNENDVTIEGGEVSTLWMQNPSDGAEKNTKDVKGSFAITGGKVGVVSTEPSANFTASITAGEIGRVEYFQTSEGRNLVEYITGGTFGMDVTEFCHRHYEAVENNNGKWTIERVTFDQTIKLQGGWNWFSSYINIDGEEGLQAIQTSLNGNGIMIKDLETGRYSQYAVNPNDPTETIWYGNLTETSSSRVYSIQTSVEIDEYVDVVLEGSKLDPAETENTVIIEKGWNYIAYPLDVTLSFEQALGFTPEYFDVIKGKNGSAQYYGFWVGEITNMVPGQGYMYKSNNSADIEFNFAYPASKSALVANVETVDYFWTVDAHQYPSNMTMIATLDVEGGDYEVAAFVDGEVRGSARPIYVESLDQYIVVMTINGEESANLTFKYYDLNAAEEYELSNVVVYSNNAIVGSVEKPYALTRGTVGIDETAINNINIYPNPTTTGREINLQAICDNVEVFNTLGVKVAEYQNVDSIDALETAGTYVIRVTVDGSVKHCRLIVR